MFRPGRFLGWVLPLCLLLLWFGLTRGGLVPAYLLPPPEQVWDTGLIYLGLTGGGSGAAQAHAGRFAGDAAASLLRVGSGFGLAALFGLPLGILSGRSSLVNRGFGSLVNGLRAVPGIAWLPLALVWFGIGLKTTIFLVGLAAFFPIYLNAAAGAAQVDPLLLRAGSMLGLSSWRRAFGVLVPASMGHLVTGLRLGLGIAFAYLVLGELTGVPDGLGALIMDARMLGRVDVIMVGILIIALIGRLADRALVWTLKALFLSARRMA